MIYNHLILKKHIFSFSSFTQTRGEPRHLLLRVHRGQLHRPVPTRSRDHMGLRRGQPDARAAHFLGLRAGRRHDDSDEHADLPVGAAQRPDRQVHRGPQGSREAPHGVPQHKQLGACESSSYCCQIFML